MTEQITNKTINAPPQGTFTHKIGKTTYVVSVHSSQTSKETLQDKMERLIKNECVSLVNQE
ncbi:transposon-encoded TnpW family protein [Chakrabartyella piscis]|uniref:transposon-encoded TnpW family protein n=1 Tax=Chakrabartyella piscis TaxID=2918914 RepID=UPI0029584EF2|nr:transposon-encoded TnpW family protein [Chakrabartyella piscis]